MTSRHREPWTKEEDRAFHKMWKKGVPVREIAKRLGRTYGAVAARRNTKRWKGRLGPPIDKRRLSTLFWEGLRPSQIAEKTGNTVRTIRYSLRSLGYRVRGGRRREYGGLIWYRAEDDPLLKGRRR